MTRYLILTLCLCLPLLPPYTVAAQPSQSTIELIYQGPDREDVQKQAHLAIQTGSNGLEIKIQIVWMPGKAVDLQCENISYRGDDILFDYTDSFQNEGKGELKKASNRYLLILTPEKIVEPSAAAQCVTYPMITFNQPVKP